MAVYNSSEDVVLVRISTFDSVPPTATAASVSGNEVGWHDTSHTGDVKVTSDVIGTRVRAQSPESVLPFIWSGATSTRLNLGPLSSAQVPLQISVFLPGSFDLSNYSLHWNHAASNYNDDSGSREVSGSCYGDPCHITVLHKE